MLGDVTGLKLLDTCCACDAVQAFSWHNLGAVVTACDITPKAIEIASANAAKMGLALDFVIADMQTLEPVGDGQFDIVYASYPVWVQDINEACKTWHRVLKPGGRLLWHMEHPITGEWGSEFEAAL
ncbi:MAG: class I SAM-dependent methyltransferase [Oscillospiraceae bacterium]|nr:class I SAM-dependent methyltransferase [Oscillospiraceae bacterium]